MSPWLALDPGRSKCGLVCTDASAEIAVDLIVCAPQEAWDWLQHWQACGPVAGLVVGDGTGSGNWCAQLRQAWPELALVLQPEAGSTLVARKRYWQLWPARGWRQLLPVGLRLPPRPVDDLAALVLLEAHLGRQLQLAPGD
jgi:hypothetical protein